METNESKLINEISIIQLVEEIRSSYAHMLKVHLQLYKKHDQYEKDVRKRLTDFYRIDPPYYEEKKINWEVIHQFIPPDMEKHFKEKYSALNEHETRLCYLLFFKVSNKTISEILPYSQESIYPTIGRIRQKTGLKGLTEMFQFMALYNIRMKKN